jgi:hypothetical protein
VRAVLVDDDRLGAVPLAAERLDQDPMPGERALRAFEDADGFSGPCELLVGAETA